jgi:MATE family multidrug resistance protein
MTKKNEMELIMRIALPLMAALLAQRGMQFVDTIMMGWIGPTALAAGALGIAFFITILLFCMGVLSAIGIFIVRAKGAYNSSDITCTLQHGFFLALFLSVPCMLLIWFAPYLLFSIGEDPLVVKDTLLLLHGMVWGFPGFLFFLVLQECVAAFSLTLIVMAVSLFSIPLTFVANYILIYGKYHLPKLGIAGIGYGGSVVMWFMFFCLLAYSVKHPLLRKYIALKPFVFDPAKLKNILRMGIPSGVLFLLDAGMFLSTAVMMGYFGVAALAAHQIALQCVNIAYTLPVALSMATALRVGHAAGTKNIVQAQQTALLSFGIVLLVSAIIVLIFVFASDFLVSLFLERGANNFKEVHSLAVSFMHIAALFLCFDAIQSVANGALRGLKDTFVPMLLSIGCYWVLGVGGAYYFSMQTYLTADGIWYGLTLGLCSTAMLLVFRFFKKLKIEKNTTCMLNNTSTL